MADIEQETIASQANKTAENTPSVGDNPKKSFLSKIPHAKIVVPVGIFCLLIIGGIVSLTYINKQQTKQTQVSVYKALRSADFKTAQNLAQEGLKKNPNDKYLQATLIDAISGEGNQTGKEKEALVKAQPYIDNVLKSNANDRDALISVGYAYEAAGEYEKALTYYEQAIALDPKFAPAYFHKGHTLAFLDRAQESQAAYDKAYALDPNDPLILIVKGNQLQSEEKYDQALSLFLKAANNENSEWENRAEAYTAASIVENKRGNSEKAFSHSYQALRYNPSYSLGLGEYGLNLLVTKNDGNSSTKYIAQAIKANSRISRNYMLLGLTLRTYKHFNDAIKSQVYGISLIPNDNTVVGLSAKNEAEVFMDIELAQTYYLSGDEQSALKYISSSIKKNTNAAGVIRKLIISNKYFENMKNDSKLISLL